MRARVCPTLVILAGGIGSRYGGLKQLDELGPAGETICDFSVFDGIRAGFEKIVFVVQESNVDAFRSRVSNRFVGRIPVEFVFQPVEPEVAGIGAVQRARPWGTGHAVLVAKEMVDDPFAVINADDFYGAEAFRKMHQFLTERVRPDSFAMVGYKLSKTLSTFGSVSRAICTLDDSNYLVSVIEYTKLVAQHGHIIDRSSHMPVSLSGNDLVSMNFWGFHPAIFSSLEAGFGLFAAQNQSDPLAEFHIPAVVDSLIQTGVAAVEVLTSREQWLGLTYAEDKSAVRDAILQLTKQNNYPSPLW